MNKDVNICGKTPCARAGYPSSAGRTIVIRVLTLITTVLVVSGCIKTFYTEKYFVGEPPEDLYAPETVIEDFHGWDLYLSVTNAYEDPNRDEVRLDSAHVRIGAGTHNMTTFMEDSIWVDSVTVTLLEPNRTVVLVQYSRYRVPRSATIWRTHEPVHIPRTNEVITVGFTVHLIKPDGQRYEKRWEDRLHRFEEKDKGLLLD